MNFRTRITLITVVAAALFGGAIFYYLYESGAAALSAQVTDQYEYETKDSIRDVDRFLFMRKSDILIAASSRVFEEEKLDPKAITERLTDFRNTYKCYLSLSFYDLKGIKLADTSGLLIGKDESDQKFFKNAVEKGYSFAEEVAVSRSEGPPTAYFSALVKDKDGQPMGVVVSRMPLYKLKQFLPVGFSGSPRREAMQISVDIVDKEMKLLYSTKRGGRILEKIVLDENVAREIAKGKNAGFTGPYRHNKGGSYYYSFDLEPGYMDFKGNGWLAITTIPEEAILGPVNRLKARMLFIFLIGIFIILLSINFIARRLMRPLARFADAAAAIAKGDLDVKIERSSADEIGRLAAAFGKMVTELKASKAKDEEYARALEVKVLERTKALNESVEELRDTQKATLSILEDTDEGKKRLEATLEELNKASEELKRNYDTQRIINTLLFQVSLDIPIEKFLDRVLQLLLSIPWLPLQAKGAIFLVEDKPDVLVMKAQRGISDEVLLACKNVPFGKCVCGRAAAMKSAQFAKELDDSHEVKCASMTSHGYYCVPIMIHNKVLGIIKLYLKENGELSEKAEDFLITIANTLAETLEHRRMEQELMESHRDLERKVMERTTELMDANDQLERTAEELKRAVKARSDFLANMSHELRTPLNSINGFSEVLYDETFGPLTAKQKEYVGYILGSGKHLLSLINDVLDLAKVEAGKMELIISKFSVKALLEESLVMIKEMAFVKKLKASLDMGKDADMIEADERKIKQILYNLLSNAVKFTPEGGEIVIRVKKINGSIEISVRDTGIGIAPEHLGKLFGVFARVEEPYSREVEGTGLGLSLSRRFAELHGGKIWLESEGLGKGTTARLTLPISRS